MFHFIKIVKHRSNSASMFNDRFGTNGLIKQELEEKKGATTPLLLKSVQFLVTFFLFSNTYLPTQCLRGRPCRAVAVAVGSRSCHLGQKVYQPRAMQRTKKKIEKKPKQPKSYCVWLVIQIGTRQKAVQICKRNKTN